MKIPFKGKQSLILFLGTTALILVFWQVIPGGWQEDGSSDYKGFYRPVALNLVAGRGLTMPDGRLGLRSPPGYPLWLAGCFELERLTGLPHTFFQKVFTLVAMGLSSIFLFKLTEPIIGSRGAFIAAWIWATYPFNLWLTKQPNSEIAFLPFFLGALRGFGGILWQHRCRSVYPFLVGALLGAAALIRPFTIMLVLILSALLWLLRREESPKNRGIWIAWLLLGNFLILIPWEMWVWQKTGQWIPLSTSGPYSLHDGWTFGVRQKGYRKTLALSPDVRGIMHRFEDGWQSGRLRTSGAIFRFISMEFSDNPRAMGELIFLKMGRAWYGTDEQGGIEKAILPIQLIYLTLASIGLYILWGRGRIQREWIIIAIVLLLYSWFMTTLVLSILRYMTPSMSLLFPGIAALVTRNGKNPLSSSKMIIKEETDEAISINTGL